MLSHRTFGQALNYIVRIFLNLVRYFTLIITLFSPFIQKKTVPTLTNDLLKISAKQLTVKIRKREIKSEEVIKAYIDWIKIVNPIINSVVQERFEDAIKEAIEVDRLIENTSDVESLAKEKPLLGVPLTVKETIAVKNMSNNGARSRISSNIAKEDAEAVALLRKAGAIPLVVTNTPELCLYLETFNPVHGRTNNPYDTRRTCSGSSGGEAGLLGAGASLLSIGSDIAGSLRLPAMFCGVFSHKPTPGFVPNNGHIPSCNDPMWDYFFTIGPLARYVEDLPLLLKCMIPTRNHIERLCLDESVNIRDIKVYYMYGEGSKSTLQDEPNFQMKKTVKSAVDIMSQNYKCYTTKVDLSYFRNSIAFIYFILKMKGIENVFQKDDEDPDDYSILRMLELLFKKFTFQTNASLSSILFGPLQCLQRLAPNWMEQDLEKRLDYAKRKIIELLGDDGVLIYPTFSREAQYHNRMSGEIINVSYLTLFNVLGLPVTQCHIRFTREHLPIGVQIVAAPKMDRLCLAMAEALSKVTGGWQQPVQVSDK